MLLHAVATQVPDGLQRLLASDAPLRFLCSPLMVSGVRLRECALLWLGRLPCLHPWWVPPCLVVIPCLVGECGDLHHRTYSVEVAQEASCHERPLS